jgi:hypothetical protein
MGHRWPVLFQHQPDLVQHRRHGGQCGRPGQPLDILADQTVDGERQFVCGDLGFGADAPVLHDLRMLTDAGDQPDDRMGVADIYRQQHVQRGDIRPDASAGT